MPEYLRCLFSFGYSGFVLLAVSIVDLIGNIQAVSVIIATLSTIIAACALINNTNQQKTNLLFEIYKEDAALRKHIGGNKGDSSAIDKEMFFNHFEMISFLLNNGRIRKDDVQKLFLPGIKGAYDALNSKHKIVDEKYAEIRSFIESMGQEK